MDKELFNSYREIDKEIKEKTKEKKEIGDQIIATMKDDNIKTAKATYGTFSVVERTTKSFNKEAKARITSQKNKAEAVEIEAGNFEEATSESIRYQEKKSNVEHTEDLIV